MAHTRIDTLKIKWRNDFDLSFNEEIKIRGYYRRANYFDKTEKIFRLKYIARKIIPIDEY